MPAIHRAWHSFERGPFAGQESSSHATDRDGGVLVSLDDLPVFDDAPCVLCKFAQDEIVSDAEWVIRLAVHGVFQSGGTAFISPPIGNARGRSPPVA